MHEKEFAPLFLMSSGQLAQKIPAVLALVGRAACVFQLVAGPENGPFRPGVESLGIKQCALVVVPQQANPAFHNLIDHLARIWSVSNQVAKTEYLGNALIANVGQNRFEALDVAVDVAYEGSFHALKHRRWPDQLEGGVACR